MKRYWHFPLALLGLWAALVLLLSARSPVEWLNVRGWYAQQGASAPYRWTSNRLVVPIRRHDTPIEIELTLASPRWPGRPAPRVVLLADRVPLAALDVPEQPQAFQVVLPPGTAVFELLSPADRPPMDDGRYLGVQVFELQARAHGWARHELIEALVATALLGLLALAAAWCQLRGYLQPAALLALALLLRVVWLRQAPAGFSQGEAVSLVDAWNLLTTGRDHLGHWLPLGTHEALGDWIAPLLTYLELPAVALLGPVPLAGRLTTAFVGALAAPLCYAVARRLALPRAAALLAGLAAAISPWQLLLSRLALPPALVPTGWALCLLCALWFVQRGSPRAALGLACAAGLAVYSYPAMQVAVPLLVAWALALAIVRHLWAVARCWPALAVLGLLWLPFGYDTWFNAASSAWRGQLLLRAATPNEWMAAWWAGYSAYARPARYFAAGADLTRGLPGRSLELSLLAPLIVLGIGLLFWRLGMRRVREPSRHARWSPAPDWWLVLGALLLAPLPASLAVPGSYIFRAAPLAPMLALLAGIGLAVVWQALNLWLGARQRRLTQLAVGTALVLLLGWQAFGWLSEYLVDYPPQVAGVYQDGLIETFERVAAYAAQADEIWVDTAQIADPYIYLLAARSLPPATAQTQISVERRPGQPNVVARIGKYRFLALTAIPRDLPLLEALPDQYGQPGFVVQRWERDGKRLLIVRRM